MPLKISLAPAVVTPAPTDEYATAQAGVSRRTTRLQMFTAEAGEQFLADFGDAVAPGFAYNGDAGTGWFRAAIGQLNYSANGVARYRMDGNQISSLTSFGFFIDRIAATATNPVFNFNGDSDTGPGGRRAADEGTLVAGGVEVAAYVEAAGLVQLALPLQSNAGTPSLAFGVLANDGIFSPAAGILSFSVAGARQVDITTSNLLGITTNNFQILHSTGLSDTAPTYTWIGDSTTGMNRRVASVGVLIANAQNCIEFGGIGSVPQVGFYGTAAIVLQTGVAVTAAGIHASLVNLGLITA